MKNLAVLLLTNMLWVHPNFGQPQYRPPTIKGSASVELSSVFSPDTDPMLQFRCAPESSNHYMTAIMGTGSNRVRVFERSESESWGTAYVSVSTKHLLESGTGQRTDEYNMFIYRFTSGYISFTANNFIELLTRFENPKSLTVRVKANHDTKVVDYNVENVKEKLCTLSYACDDSIFADAFCTSTPEELIQEGSAADLANKLFEFIQDYIRNHLTRQP